MALALTATPDPIAHRVDLLVTGATGAITVTAYVATASYQVRGTFANGRVTPDPDAPLNIDIVYIARDTLTQSPQVTARLDSTVAVLSSMANPSLYASAEVLEDGSQSYEGFSVAHKVLGTSAPIVTVEAMAFRSGTYRLRALTVDDWILLRAIVLPGQVLLLRSPCPSEYLDTTFMVAAVRVELRWKSAPPRQRIVEIDYQSVQPDTTPPTAIAWTWADLPTLCATWADVPVTFATWADVVAYVPVP
jgi:hypothetical protein